MNAIVEVATAEVVAETVEALALVTRVFVRATVATPKVATFTQRVRSIAGTSISAVAPDHILIGGLA